MANRYIFLLIDGHALIYRAFYAFPKLTSFSGQLVNAVYGFSRMLLTSIRHFEPVYMAVTFDHPKPTFRHQDYEDYKAHRPEMPDDLKPQIEYIKEVVATLNIPQFEVAGFEADDLIGTINFKVEDLNHGLLTVVVTGDQDIFQLVDDDTHVWLPGRGKRQQDTEYDEEKVKAKVGVAANRVTDLKALMGDSSDNIPGVKGIGPKTAAKLIQAFGSLEKLYEAVETGDEESKAVLHPILKGSLLSKLIASKEDAFLSKKLATIERDVKLDFDLEACRVSSYDKSKAVELFKNLGFNSLLNLLPEDEFENQVQEALF